MDTHCLLTAPMTTFQGEVIILGQIYHRKNCTFFCCNLVFTTIIDVGTVSYKNLVIDRYCLIVFQRSQSRSEVVVSRG